MNTNKLYIGNLNYQTDQRTLEQAFSEYGDVIEVTIIEGRGFGFVEMDSNESAQSAMDALNGTEIDGRSIRVDEARPKRREDRDRGGYDNRRGGRGYDRGGGGGGRRREPRW